jgi:D-isomer specific 2-hydroxyacid dehydrogenase, catalytic domain
VAVSRIVARCVARSAHSLLRAAENGGAGLRYAGNGRLAPGHGRRAAFFDICRLFPCAGLFQRRHITARIGSDHVDLQAAIDRGITVAEVTYSTSISISEHVVMMILGLVRNAFPPNQRVVRGGRKSSPERARIPTALGMRPADPRRLRNSRTPCDDAHEPATALSPPSPARQWDRPIRGPSATARVGRVSLRARAVAVRSIVYLGNVG